MCSGRSTLLCSGPTNSFRLAGRRRRYHPAHSQPLLISASTDDTTIRAWNCQTGEEILRLITAAPVTSLAVLPPDTHGQDGQPTIVFGSPRGLAASTVHL